jgi:hypothetical protein
MEKQMEITHQQLMAALIQTATDARNEHATVDQKQSLALENAYGFGYMTSWFASIAQKHPAVLKELLSDPRVIRAQQSLENAR